MHKLRTRLLRSFFASLFLLGVAGMGVAGFQIYEGRQIVGSQVLPTFGPLESSTSPIFHSPTIVQQVHYSSQPKIGDVIGSLSLPTLKEKLPIIEGTDSGELKRGVGHYVRSVLPGLKDNSVLAGHRDTVFSNLGKLALGDPLIVRTSAGQFTYIVSKFRIVNADDRTVIVPTPSAVLTLSTCYPFRYIGNAPKRYIVSANLVASDLAMPVAS